MNISLNSIDKTEALYYLGFHGQTPETRIFENITKCEAELLKQISPKAIYIVIGTDDPVLQSEDLKQHLSGCKKAVLFAATLGSGADKAIYVSGFVSPEFTLYTDALANAAIEQVCDEVELEIKKLYGCEITTRFSPGYGDFPLERQPEILQRLNAFKIIGLRCKDSLMMEPTKSVTAVFGIAG
ncbi:MAG: methionine synthase [Ruminococcus sp.]|jgi:5-methyltetrahydrofolate--homocysteine methyltransferase|nr:methionine synthase [Ruminococcus sp.]